MMDRPGLWKLAPAVVTKPWGLVHEEVLAFTGIEVGLGEFWLASAQTGPGNYSNLVVEPALRKTLAELLTQAAAEGVLGDVLGARAASLVKDEPHRGKTEAWHVRLAQGRTGVAAGPASAEDAARLKHLILTQGLPPDVEAWSDEVRRLFGLVEPLQGGEVFLAPAGTLHTMFAVGRESRLIIDEVQQGYGECLLPTLSKILCVQDDLLSVQVHPDDATVAAAAAGELRVGQDLQANPTVRLYDFGRRPGEDPEMGFRLVNPEAGLRRVCPVVAEPAEGQRIEVIVADRHFARSRVSIRAGRAFGLTPLCGSYRVLHWLDGTAELTGNARAMEVRRGETVFVPACLEAGLRIEAATDCVLFDDAFAEVVRLAHFLARNGASAEQIEALLAPPRAIQAPR